MSTMTIEVKEWREKGLQVVKLHKQIRNLELIKLTIEQEYRELKAKNTELEKEIKKAKTLSAMEYFKSFNKLPIKDLIVRVVLEHYNVEMIELQDQNREKNIVRVRMVLSYLLRDKTTITFHEIGDLMNKDHATCQYHVRTVKQQYPYFKDEISEIEKAIQKKIKEEHE